MEISLTLQQFHNHGNTTLVVLTIKNPNLIRVLSSIKSDSTPGYSPSRNVCIFTNNHFTILLTRPFKDKNCFYQYIMLSFSLKVPFVAVSQKYSPDLLINNTIYITIYIIIHKCIYYNTKHQLLLAQLLYCVRKAYHNSIIVLHVSITYL